MATPDKTVKTQYGEFSRKLAKNVDSNRAMFIQYLRCDDILPYITGQITEFDSDFQSRVEAKLQEEGKKEANELLLRRLEESTYEAKWLTFAHILLQRKYEMLMNLMWGEPVCPDREIRVEQLQQLTPVIKDKIDPLKLLPHLIKEGCINDDIDKRDIELEVGEKGMGKIQGTLLLLSRITRLKDDWFRGFMMALKRANYHQLMAEIDPSFAEEILDETELKSRLCALDLSRNNDSAEMSPGASPESPGNQVPFSDLQGETSSLASSSHQTLELRDYQKELCLAVPRNTNALILAPRGSGKTYVALKLIQDHLSDGTTQDGKVVYLVGKAGKPNQVLKFCKQFFSKFCSAEIPAKMSTSDVVQNNAILVGMPKMFHKALKEDCLNLAEVSLLILDLSLDEYLKEEDHVYKQMMVGYNELRQKSGALRSVPQIVVLSRSICGKSPLKDLYCTAMETCAGFHIQKTILVEENRQNLRRFVSIPVVERIPIPSRKNNGFAEALQELMSRVEIAVKDTYLSLEEPADHPVDKGRMSVLCTPPDDRYSVDYMTWLTTNKARLGDAVKRNKCRPSEYFLACLRLLTFFQNALFINTEGRSINALKYMKSKISHVSIGESLNESMKESLSDRIEDFEEMAQNLGELCSVNGYDDPLVETLEKTVEEFFRENWGKKVVVLVKYRVSALSVMLYLKHSQTLRGIKVEVIMSHERDYTKDTSRLFDTGFNVLITSWPILCFHLGKEQTPWDCVIRLDCPGNNLMVWKHQEEPNEPCVSQFSYRKTNVTCNVDLLRESSIDTSILEIAQLQRESMNDYQEMSKNIRTAEEQRRRYARRNPDLKDIEESNVDFFCNGCGTFVCNASYVRQLDSLRLCLDPKVIHRLKTIIHPAQIVFSDGFGKLGRMVCKRCGRKWGIVVDVMFMPFLTFAKEGLDILRDGQWELYCWKWKDTKLVLEGYENRKDHYKCLPDTFCVDGVSIADLDKRLPKACGHL